MKIKVLAGLMLFITIMGYPQTPDYDEDCSGEVTYYTVSKVYIYESMNTNASVLGEIPAGEPVIIESKFFDDHGWWKICYKGSTGHAEKDLFSETNVASEPINPTELSPDNQAGDIRPFLARATTALNFRSEPSRGNTWIKLIPRGAVLFVYSGTKVNHYYKTVEVSTGQIGWAHKNFIKYFQVVKVSKDGAFANNGYSASQYSDVLIKNNSSQATKLLIGSETFSLDPNSVKAVKVAPGRKYFVAITPGVIPVAGYQIFESNNEYEWEF
jgi:hypothetical protein